jgi:hypothetical protein
MVAAEWLWKIAICANLHPLVDNHKSFVVDSGIYLPLFFLGGKLNQQGCSQNHPRVPEIVGSDRSDPDGV